MSRHSVHLREVFADLRAPLASAALVGVSMLAIASLLPRPWQPPAPPAGPVEQPREDYVTSNACRSCHPAQHASWSRSYHRTMTQLPSTESVLGDFEDVELRLNENVFRLHRDGDQFFSTARPFRADGAESGAGHTSRVALLTGSHHFQVYWLESGESRKLELLPLAHQIDEDRWIPFDALLLAPPRLRQVGGEGGQWNKGCIYCHSTGGVPGVRSDDEMETEAVQFGIACEACHGPGEAHVELFRSPLRRYARHFGAGPGTAIVNPSDLDPLRSIQVCGQCHSVQRDRNRAMQIDWLANGSQYRPGDDLERTLQMVREDPPSEIGTTRFWPDGRTRVNGREYLEVAESACFRSGEFTCLTCHTMHPEPEDPRPLGNWAEDQLQPDMRRPEACLGCHPALSEPRALEAHTHHSASSSGSDCYDCHMANTVFGLHKATRSHRVASPTVTESLETGRPNACSLCHLDRPLGWVADRLEDWYGTPRPALGPDEEAIAAGVLWALRGDANQRALVAWHLGYGPTLEASGSDWVIPYLGQLMLDPYTVNRSVAHRALRKHEGYEDYVFDYLAPEPELEREVRQLVERWLETADLDAREPARRAPVLIDEGGNVIGAEFNRLVGERDQRYVYLKE